jgi:starch synthase
LQARVLLVSSEAVPLVKTGGLADVITALAVSLRKVGIDASILMPAYPEAVRNLGDTVQIGLKHGCPAAPAGSCAAPSPVPTCRRCCWIRRASASAVPIPISIPMAPSSRQCAVLRRPLARGRGHLRRRDQPAGAACGTCQRLACRADPCLLKLRGLDHIGTMLTIHNLAFQGNFALSSAEQIGIPQHLLTGDGVEYWGKLSFLKAGIRFSDCVSTVSRNYAQEIMTPRFGCGMDGILSFRKLDLRAIPNAIDAELWNPADDPLIARNFSVGNMKGKSSCKRDLQKLFGLPIDPFAPVMGLGSRISHQKMADVVSQSLPGIMERHARLQVVVLGCGDHDYEAAFQALANAIPAASPCISAMTSVAPMPCMPAATCCCTRPASSPSVSRRCTPCATAPSPSARA